MRGDKDEGCVCLKTVVEEYWEAGTFYLDVDDEGKKFWRGGSPDDMDETIFSSEECLILNPKHFPEGTVVSAKEPRKPR